MDFLATAGVDCILGPAFYRTSEKAAQTDRSHDPVRRPLFGTKCFWRHGDKLPSCRRQCGRARNYPKIPVQSHVLARDLWNGTQHFAIRLARVSASKSWGSNVTVSHRDGREIKLKVGDPASFVAALNGM